MDTDNPKISRRQIAGAAVPVAQAAAPAQGLHDPKSKYPKQPFDQQSQSWPGLAGQMRPKPDHGETSYRGSGRLAGRKVLITGGDSGMGRAAAIATPVKAPMSP